MDRRSFLTMLGIGATAAPLIVAAPTPPLAPQRIWSPPYMKRRGPPYPYISLQDLAAPWDKCAINMPDEKFLDQLKPHPCFGGLDLGAVSDLTSFVMVWPITPRVYVYPHFFIPSDDLAERVKRDNVPYDAWAREGFVELTPGPVTDWRYVTARVKQLAETFSIRSIAFDRYGARDTASDLLESGIELVDMGQGYISMSAPAKRLQELVLSKNLIHTGHPILRWNVDCCTITQDATGNIKPVKPDAKKSTKRIDGVVALVMAIARASECGLLGAGKSEVW